MDCPYGLHLDLNHCAYSITKVHLTLVPPIWTSQSKYIVLVM